MRAERKTTEEQYQLVLACRRSGLGDRVWCREHGINPYTFSTWIKRLKKKGGFRIPPASKRSALRDAAHDIIRVDVLPDEGSRNPADGKDPASPSPMLQAAAASIEIEARGVAFRFSGAVDPFLYEKTLLLIGGRLL